MDLLANYGSGSESEPDSPVALRPGPSSSAPIPPPTQPIQPHSAASNATQPLVDALSSLPVPASERAPLFPGLPMPVMRRKRITAKFSCGIDYGDAPKGTVDDADEDIPASKKFKKGPGIGASLTSFLPPPKNSNRMKSSTTGGGHGGGEGGSFGGPVLGGGYNGLDVDEDIVPGAEDPSGMFLGKGDGDVQEGEDDYSYNGGLGQAPLPLPSSTAPQPRHIRGVHDGQEYIYDTVTGQYYYPDPDSNTEQQQQQQGASSADAMLAAALSAETRGGGGGGGIQFKEVSGARLRYMDPGQRAELNALRSTFGDDYENKLKSDAAKVGAVSKLAKHKHQLASLYVQAKEQELEDMEKRTTGAKSKAETARKYGW